MHHWKSFLNCSLIGKCHVAECLKVESVLHWGRVHQGLKASTLDRLEWIHIMATWLVKRGSTFQRSGKILELSPESFWPNEGHSKFMVLNRFSWKETVCNYLPSKCCSALNKMFPFYCPSFWSFLFLKRWDGHANRTQPNDHVFSSTPPCCFQRHLTECLHFYQTCFNFLFL